MNSQNDFEFTPRDSQHQLHPSRNNGSPARKRGRGKAYSISDASSSSARFRDENDGPNGLLMSQDSLAVSQFSQDFGDRYDHLMVDHGDHSKKDMLMQGSQDDSFILAPLDSSSIDNFSIPTAPTSKGRRLQMLGSQKKIDRIETEKQVDLKRPFLNPFLMKTQEGTERYFSNIHGPMRKILSMWVSAFKERPRYMSDFEELTLLGEGTFSSVCCARHRLDGTLYAIKKIKERITSESHAKLMLREACAFAALADCPNLVHYYGCWIEENQLYLQLELCHLGSLEDLISTHPSQCSIMHVRNQAHYFPKNSLQKNESISGVDPVAMDNHSMGSLESTSSSFPGSGSLQMDESNASAYMHSQLSQANFGVSSSWEGMKNTQDTQIPSSSAEDGSFSTPRVHSSGAPNNLQSQFYQSKASVEVPPISTQENSYLSQPPMLTVPEVSGRPLIDTDCGRNRGISESLAWLILSEVAKTLVYMHARGLVHLDLRPANFFMKAVSKPASYSTASFRPLSQQSQRHQLQKSRKSSKESRLKTSLFATVMQQTGAATSLTQSMGNLHLQSSQSHPTQSRLNSNDYSCGHADSSLSIQIPPPPPLTFSSTPLLTPINTQTHHSQSNMFPHSTSALGTTVGMVNRSQMSVPESQSQVDSWKEYFQRRQNVEDGLLRSEYVVRVGDLGLCRGVFETTGFVQEGESRYCPRELIDLDHSQLDLTKADVFSLAASVYELCLGRFLGASGEEGMEEWHNIRDGILAAEEWYGVYSPSITGLIGRMLHPDPNRRPSAAEIVEISASHLPTSKLETSSSSTGETAALETLSHSELLVLAQKLQAENRRLQQQS